MKVSIIVPTYQRAGILSHTLPTVLAQRCPAVEFEVIVVVDGSTDGTIQLLQRFSRTNGVLRVVPEEHAGPGAARNRGVAEARGEIVIFLDDDAACEPGLIAAHWEAHRQRAATVVFGPVRLSSASRDTLAARRLLAWTEAYLRRMEATGPAGFGDVWICTNTSMRRDDFLASGGFDCGLFPHEDTELAIRLWKNGMSFAYLPAATANYIYDKCSSDVLAAAAEYGAREVSVCARHPEFLDLSPLGRLDRGGIYRRAARAVAATLPFDVAASGAPLIRAVERLSVRVTGDPRGERLLRVLMFTAFLQGAARAAGGWEMLRAQCRR